jgi:hypothetical protein
MSREELLRLSPDEAPLRCVAERPADAPPLDVACELALAYQSSQEQVPEEMLGLAVAAFGMARDRVAEGRLSGAVRENLRQRLAVLAEGYPVTAAWLTALADAVASGAELENCQGFLVRTVEIRRFLAASTRGATRAP